MKARTTKKEYLVTFIRQQIHLLNSIVVISIFSVLLLNVRLLYDFLNYLPKVSVVAITTIMAAFGVMIFYLMKHVSSTAISAIMDYSRHLYSLVNASKEISEISHSDMVLEKVMSTALELTSAEGGSILLTEGDNLVFKIAKGGTMTNLCGA